VRPRARSDMSAPCSERISFSFAPACAAVPRFTELAPPVVDAMNERAGEDTDAAEDAAQIGAELVSGVEALGTACSASPPVTADVEAALSGVHDTFHTIHAGFSH
jgi:hypothetical protein